MENNKTFSKRLGLLIVTSIFFATHAFLTLSTAEAHADFDAPVVIGEDLPTNISGDFEITPSKTAKVTTNQIVKSSSRVKVVTESKICYVHVLEQQGSPTAQTVKVCE